MTNVPRRNNQHDEGANADAGAEVGGGGDNQQGQNDQTYDACTSENQSFPGINAANVLAESVQNIRATTAHWACWTVEICGSSTGCYQ